MVALHTTAGCTMENIRREMTGAAGQADCHNATNGNTGCVVNGPPATFGKEFNDAGGGLVALEWRNEGIRTWVFARDKAPLKLDGTTAANTKPDPSTWGPPLADFPSTTCDVAAHFRNQSIIVNIDLCGYLTEAVWGSSGCGKSPFVLYHLRHGNRDANQEQAHRPARSLLPTIRRRLRMRTGSLGPFMCTGCSEEIPTREVDE
jgi:hypothetical protein